MSGNRVRKLALTLFGVNTLCLFIILELLLWGVPYGAIFVVIFVLTAHYNLKAYSAGRSNRACEVIDRRED